MKPTFKLLGVVNRHNSVYYSRRKKPKLKIQQQLSNSVCAWLSYKGVIELLLFPIQLWLIPGYPRGSCTTITSVTRWQIISFLTAPNYGLNVWDFLDQNVSRGSVERPPRSPLTSSPVDFVFWGVVKDMIFSSKPRNINMVEYIRHACQ